MHSRNRLYERVSHTLFYLVTPSESFILLRSTLERMNFIPVVGWTDMRMDLVYFIVIERLTLKHFKFVSSLLLRRNTVVTLCRLNTVVIINHLHTFVKVSESMKSDFIKTMVFWLNNILYRFTLSGSVSRSRQSHIKLRFHFFITSHSDIAVERLSHVSQVRVLLLLHNLTFITHG